MTEERIDERARREFRLFKLDMLRTSRENIFAHAHEIEVKRQATRDICRMAEEGKPGPEEEARLDGVTGLLDAVFCHYESECTGGAAVSPEGAYMRWLATMGKMPQRKRFPKKE